MTTGQGPSTSSGSNDSSDFVALLNLWNYLRESQKNLSGNGFRRMCREEFLHFLRVREWQDLHTQLKQICRELKLDRNDNPAPPPRVHTAALTGLLSHVGLADLREDPKATGRRRGRSAPREYLGARGTRFAVNPGSSLARIQPPLVVAAEIVETTRLWARTVAPITAEQVEEVGQHLLKRSYSEPHWSARAGSVMAYEQVSLYGVPIVARRPVSYGRVNPAEARAIFIRSALVEGQWTTRHHFYRDNQALRAEVEALEERTRRRDLMADDEVVLAFYDARLPADITSTAHFDAWWKKARHQTPDLLTLTWADLTVSTVEPDPADYPQTWTANGQQLDLDYVFDPGGLDDGVTVQVPLSLLNQLDPRPFSWQVPGLRAELATELIRSLPKATRRNFVPAPEFARRALDWLDQHPEEAAGTLPHALGRALRALTGILVADDEWDPMGVPDHLRIRFAVRSDGRSGGEPLAVGHDLVLLKEELAGQLNQTLAAAAAELTRTGQTRWTFGTIDEEVRITRNDLEIVGYPALVDEGSTVGLAVLETPRAQRASHRAGLRRLVLLNTPDPTNWVIAHLGNADKLALAGGPYASAPALIADARLAAVGELIDRQRGGEVRDEVAFTALCDAVRADNPELMRAVVSLAARILTAHRAVAAELARVRTVSEPAAADLAEQLANLVFAGFLSATAYEHLADLPRYLQAAQLRITNLLATPARDVAPLTTIVRCEDAYAELCAQAPPGPLPDFVDDIGWLLEELRVGLFAQPLRAKVPVSEKRVLTAIERARIRLDQPDSVSGRR